MRNRPALALAALAIFTTTAHAQPGPGDGIVIRDASGFDAYGNRQEHWIPLTSDGLMLAPDEFYRRIGHPELADGRATRKTIATLVLLGGLAFVGTSIYLGAEGPDQPALMACDPSASPAQFQACGQANLDAAHRSMSAMHDHAMFVIGTALAGGLGLAASWWLFTHPEPIDEAQAQRLAAEYNARQREVRVEPYATPTGAGVEVGAHF